MSSTKQIPFRNYFDQSVFEDEQKLIFEGQPIYVGAQSELKNPGDYKVLNRMNDQKILVNSENAISLFDNQCAHRQAQLARGSGQTNHFTCNLHHWKYASDGKCISAPMMNDLDRSKFSLTKNTLSNMHDLLFTGPNAEQLISDIKSFPFYQWMDLVNMIFHKTYSEEFSCNWKHYVEVFAENYHVPFVHPGFSQFVDLNLLEWSQHERYTGQIFKMKSTRKFDGSNLTPKFKYWYRLLADYYKNNLPPYAGILMLYYPNIIIECYPLCMAVGTIHSVGPEKFVSHVDFFHHKDIIESRPDIILAAEEALNETELEDKEMCRQLAAGRKVSSHSNSSIIGPIHSELEKGLADFYQFYHNRLSRNKKAG
jgi:choline monooxygenase